MGGIMPNKRRKLIIGSIIAVTLAVIFSTFAMAAGPVNDNGFRYKGVDCPNKVDCYPCDGVCDNLCPREYCPYDKVCDRPCAQR